MTHRLPPAYGIDVSKDKLDLACSRARWRRSFPNTHKGQQELLATVAELPDATIILEPTGRYHRAITSVLTDAGRSPILVNPFQMRRYATSKGIRVKTDPIDAGLLADDGARMQPEPRPQKTQDEAKRADLVARREDLVKVRAGDKCRLHGASDPREVASIERTIAFYDAEIAILEQDITVAIAANAELRTGLHILQSTPGIGDANGPVILALLPELGNLTPKTAAALTGLAPYANQSGATDKQRSIGGGRAMVRKALYQMAFTAIRCNAVIRSHYQQLIQRGKAHKVAIIACARRMLGILNAMLREGITWQQTKVGQGQFLSASPSAA